jgi:ABC-type glycerol-3-phosphate transport system substrate-binding protein
MKKFLTSTVAAMLMLVLLAGCATPTATSTPAPTQAEAKTNMYGWVVPEKTMEIAFYQADKGSQETVDKETKQISDYILKEFNVKLVKTVYDVDTTEKLNLMLAANDYPKIIMAMSRDTVAQWGAQGKLYDMAPDVESTYKSIKSTIGSLYGMYLNEEGKLYGLPRGWGYLPIPDVSAHIRWDWYLEMGSPKIETTEDYYNVLKQMVAAHPTNAAGDKVYAISWSTDQCNIKDIMGAYGLKDGYKVAADNTLTHWVNTEEGLAAIQWYNRFYREGLMDPDSFTNKYDNDWKPKFVAERIVGLVGGWWQSWNAGHEVWSKDPTWTENKRYVQISIKGVVNGVTVPTANLSGKNTLGWNYTVITDKASAEERADYMRFFEFAMSPMGVRIFGWGVPNLTDASDGLPSYWTTDGKTWAYDPTLKELMMAGEYSRVPNWSTRGQGQYWISQGQAETVNGEEVIAWADQNFNFDPAPAAKWRRMMNENLKDTIFDNTARIITFKPDDPLTIKNQQIEDATIVGYVKAIMSDTEAECIANYNEMKDALNALGLHEIEAFRTAEYKKNLDKMK